MSSLMWTVCVAGAFAFESSSEVTIFVAASAHRTIVRLADRFEQTHGVHVNVNMAGSHTLANQIAAGAPADIFLSANKHWIDHLEKKQLVEHTQILASNQLVVVVPQGADSGIYSLADLAQEQVRYIAIGDPKGVPAGIYAKRALEQGGLWEHLQPKLIPCANVRNALMLAENGMADAALVYASDATGRAVDLVVRIDVAVVKPQLYMARITNRPQAQDFQVTSIVTNSTEFVRRARLHRARRSELGGYR